MTQSLEIQPCVKEILATIAEKYGWLAAETVMHCLDDHLDRADTSAKYKHWSTEVRNLMSVWAQERMSEI